jgi:hypothetical protein
MRDFVATDSVANGLGKSATVILRRKPGFTFVEDTNAACPVSSVLEFRFVYADRAPADTASTQNTPSCLRGTPVPLSLVMKSPESITIEQRRSNCVRPSEAIRFGADQ